MNSKHNVNNLDLLYADAKRLINDVVVSKIDEDVLKSFNDIISNIDEYWRVQDAIIQVNKLIDMNNLLIDNRDIVGNIGVYISMLAKGYRDVQNSNSVILPSFTQLEYKKINKTQILNTNSSEIFMSNNISNVVTILNNSLASLEDINASVLEIKNSIISNWVQEDENRNYALKMFDKFFENITSIIKNINEIISCINTSIDSYNSTLNNATSMPSLESMFNTNDNNLVREYTVEEQNVLDNIEKNFDSNKELTTNFNNILISEVKKDLVNKGIIE